MHTIQLRRAFREDGREAHKEALMSNAAIIRRAITEYSADVTPLDESLTSDELATMLEQLTFTRDRGFVRLLTIDRGVRDYLVRASRGKG
jgi:hypothetical protein